MHFRNLKRPAINTLFIILTILIVGIFIPPFYDRITTPHGQCQRNITIALSGTAQAYSADYTIEGYADDEFLDALAELTDSGGQIVDICGRNYQFLNLITMPRGDIQIIGQGGTTTFSRDGSSVIFSDGGYSNVIFKDFKTDGGNITRNNNNDSYCQNVWIGDDYVFEPAGGGGGGDDMGGVDTEAELETTLIDVTNVYTDNDGALNDDDVTLSDVQSACTNDFHNIGGVDDTGTDDDPQSLDDAYDDGSSVTVDSTDIIWNITGTNDIYIQDNGTNVHKWDDVGLYTITGNDVTKKVLDATGNIDVDNSVNEIFMEISPVWDTGTSSTLTGAMHGLYLTASLDTEMTGGIYKVPNVRGAYIGGNYRGDISGGTIFAYSEGVFGAAQMSCSVSGGSTTVYGYDYGLNYQALRSGTITDATVEDELVCVYGKTTNSINVSSGSYIGRMYGGLFNATGDGTEGTQINYGIKATSSGSDDNYAGWFYRNVGDTVPVVFIEQDHSSGLGACIELQQDDSDKPFIAFTGTAPAATNNPSGVLNYYWDLKVLVDINGSDYWLYLVAD